MRPASLALFVALLAGAGGCRPDEEAPRTLITGPRVLAIVAEPPSVAAGESATVTALIADSAGRVSGPTVSWSRCRLAPLPGQSTNPDCVTVPDAAYLEPIGEGMAITATMPADITPEALGQPDASGGVYLTLVARVTNGADVLSAVYRLRLSLAAGDRNGNPVQVDLFAVVGGGNVSLEEAAPRTVRAGERLGVGVAIADGSVETYTAPRGGPSGGPVTEVVRTAWFSTAGELSEDSTNAAQPTTELILERFLPAPGSTIDLYAVTRDERGGADFSHRTLRLE